jgi:hypothetical protein
MLDLRPRTAQVMPATAVAAARAVRVPERSGVDGAGLAGISDDFFPDGVPIDGAGLQVAFGGKVAGDGDAEAGLEGAGRFA